MKVDLHIHTYYSDSTFSPKEVVKMAKDKGLQAIAITDHDIVEGILEAQQKGREVGIEVIPGVELSVLNKKHPEKDIHLLGYFVDFQNKDFLKTLKKFQKRRYYRTIEMVKKLKECGMEITFEEVKKISGQGTLGKLHIAVAVCKKKEFNNLEDIFIKYLNYGCPAYAEKYRMEIKEAIEVIRNCKGVPVLAHPSYSKCEDIIESSRQYGLMGIEVYHPEQNEEDRKRLIQIAKRYNLLITGGSDCHGLNKDNTLIGKVTIDGDVIESLKELKEKLKL